MHPFADDPRMWDELPAGWLGQEEEQGLKPKDGAGSWREVRVDHKRWHGNTLLLRFAGMEDRNAAESIIGLLFGVPRERLPQPGEGEYYWGDLLGLQVISTEDQVLGEVLGLIETGANTVLRVGTNGESNEASKPSAERLLPFVDAVVLEVDLAGRRIRVDWGLDW